VNKVIAVAEQAEKKYFQGLSTMERTAVHPAYWNRGHGTTLTQWGTKLADIDRVNQGVLASSMGAALFKHVGFQYITDVHIEGDKEDPDGFSVAVLRYEFCLE